MRFDIIASTGRTATTYLAAVLEQFDGIVATHEGYRGYDKDAAPLLPQVNLENAAAYASRNSAWKTVSELRNPDIVTTALKRSSAEHLIDVAYYNVMIGHEILAQHPRARMIGIIRECEEFVRSATTIRGEDPLPVGWPDPDKPLTNREKFIGMGRIRPLRGSPDRKNWANWGAIRRNIWLWQETNLRLCAAKEVFGNRVALLRFSTFRSDAETFWKFCSGFLSLAKNSGRQQTTPEKTINKKPFGYQIGSADSWSLDDQAALMQAESLVEKAAHYAI